LVSPVTVAVVVVPLAVVALKFPGLDVTVYEVIGEPPVLVGAVQLTLAWALPAVAVTLAGGLGDVDAALKTRVLIVQDV